MSLLDDIKALPTYSSLEVGARVQILCELRYRGEPIPEWMLNADIEFIAAELITIVPVGDKFWKRWPARKDGVQLEFVSPKPKFRGTFITTLEPREWKTLFERHG